LALGRFRGRPRGIFPPTDSHSVTKQAAEHRVK
jgi:hypothetical protein